jgi:pentatricopeptide repeat protein
MTTAYTPCGGRGYPGGAPATFAKYIPYKCVIDALNAASEHDKAEEFYLTMLERGLTLSHWSLRDKGKLDFHQFTEGVAAAALRIVLRAIVEQKATDCASYVHPIANALHIITGHGTGDGKQGSVLQPVLIAMLKQLKIKCYINPNSKGRLVISSSNLRQHQRNNAV